jgi:thiol-disulfide isomerase/thioredoxin
MKLTNILFVALVLLFATTTYAQKELPSSLTLETMKGQKVNLKDYVAKKGKVTVISFWATWCKPCKEELDNIASDYYDDWKEEYDIEFIAISMDNARTKSKVAGTVDVKGWEYDILCNPDNSAYQAIGFNVVPFTLLVDADGNVVYKHKGYKPGDEEDLEEAIIEATE